MAGPFPLGDVEIAVPDALVTPEIGTKLADGSYEADEAQAVDRCVKPGFRVLDLGAGLGYIGALAAQRTDPTAVMSVEANPSLIPVLKANLARNGASGATVLHAAVAGRAAEGEMAHLHIATGFTASRLGARGGAQVEVPLVGFHDLLRAHRPHVVFMDVEGAEAAFFDRPWKCPLRFCVMEIHPKQYGPEVVKRIVDAMSAMDMTYDPVTSRGKILGFRRVWGAAPPQD